MRWASSTVAAMGFSHITCFPASSAATEISQWDTFGGQHMDRLDGRVGQQVVVVRVGFRAGRAIFRGGFFRALGDQVAEGHQVGPVGLVLQGGQMLLVGDAAAADDTDFNTHNLLSFTIQCR